MIFITIGLQSLFNNAMRGVLLICVGFILWYIIKKISRHETYRKKMYDLMKESVELQKNNSNE